MISKYLKGKVMLMFLIVLKNIEYFFEVLDYSCYGYFIYFGVIFYLVIS